MSLHSLRTPLLLLAALTPGCQCGGPRFDVTVRIVGEAGEVLPGAVVTVDGEERRADGGGEVRLTRFAHPVLAVVTEGAHIVEPVVLGWEADGGTVEVGLLERGERIVMHSGGDTMIGRRYEQDGLVGDDGAGAEDVVSDLVALFTAADLRTLNLETVVGDRPEDEAYPAKRWLLQTPPGALDALDALRADVVVLGNNHQRDWLDSGLQGSLDAMDAAGLEGVGAGFEDACAPLVVSVDGVDVGVLSFTSVDGDFVNDNYPDDDQVAPDPVPAEDEWLWETRYWGFADAGVASANRRVGEAWRRLERAEAEGLDEDTRAALWDSATETYPELQDWVARRGHGGACRWDADKGPAAIEALRPDVDLLVVQVHAGFQFAAAPGTGARDIAYAAIDAGADTVIGHHPHVLQGLEWYRGHLIAWSLGNLLFDQDFLSTFRSVVLRTVWEPDGTLVQARLYPVFLGAYRPVPVGGRTARGVLRQIWARSVADATAARDDDLSIKLVDGGVSVDTQPIGVRLEHGTGVLLDQPPLPDPVSVSIKPGRITRLPDDVGLLRVTSGADGVELGRKLYGLGHFEDEDTDDDSDDVLGWRMISDDATLLTDDPISGTRSLELTRDQYAPGPASARTLARVTLPAHRIYDDDLRPLDGDARYSLHLRARITGEDGLASATVALYHFDDLDPTRLPESTALHQAVVDIEDGDNWLDLPSDALEPVDGLAPSMALLTLSLDAPDSLVTRLVVDDVDLVEWRVADGRWADLDYARSVDGGAHTVGMEALDW